MTFLPTFVPLKISGEFLSYLTLTTGDRNLTLNMFPGNKTNSTNYDIMFISGQPSSEQLETSSYILTGGALRAYFQTYCGNGVVEEGETCETSDLQGNDCTSFGYSKGALGCTGCAFDTSGCSYAGGGGSGGGGTALGTIISVKIYVNRAFFEGSNLQKDVPAKWSNPNLTASKIIEINLTTNAYIYDMKIDVMSITAPAGLPSLENSYQYLNITTENIDDSKIKRLKMKFAVENSWISSNNIDDSKIALNRYTTTWAKLQTTKISKDDTYTYFEAVVPGFSIFAITGELRTPGCPGVRPADEPWSDCIADIDEKGSMTRISYECNAATGFTWTQTTETQKCCPTCQEPSEWSECIDDKHTRTEYICDGYQCKSKVEKQACVSVIAVEKPFVFVIPEIALSLIIGIALTIVGIVIGLIYWKRRHAYRTVILQKV